MVKKVIFTLDIGNYAPEIKELTFPFLKHYAEKIGADFQVITERKFPHLSIACEKLQVGESKSEWSIFFDADALIHPDFFDVTSVIPKDTVMCKGADTTCNADFLPIRFRPDKYFLRDGRNIGWGNWMAVASDWCYDLWTPPTETKEELLSNIFPTNFETKAGIDKEHLLDDYILSRNVARYGLKFKSLLQVLKEQGIESHQYFHHEYLIPTDKKVESLKRVIKSWGIESYLPDHLQEELSALEADHKPE